MLFKAYPWQQDRPSWPIPTVEPFHLQGEGYAIGPHPQMTQHIHGDGRVATLGPRMNQPPILAQLLQGPIEGTIDPTTSEPACSASTASETRSLDWDWNTQQTNIGCLDFNGRYQLHHFTLKVVVKRWGRLLGCTPNAAPNWRGTDRRWNTV